MGKKYACILIDVLRNKAIGRFGSMQEAIAYAKEEGICTVTWEFVKETTNGN